MTEIKENIKNFTIKLKAKVEELELQMHLGKKESLDEFENQKDKMKEFIHHSEDNLKNAQEIGVEKLTSLKAKLDELKLQLALGRAESMDKLDEQRTKLNHAMHELQSEFIELKGKTGSKTDEITGKMGEYFDEFKTKMDIFRLNVALGSADAKDDWNEKKKDMQGQLNTMKAKLNDSKNIGEEKLGEFGKEISESFTHFKNAFKNLV